VAKRVYVNPYAASVAARSIDGFVALARQSGLGLAAFWKKINAAEVFASRKREKDFVHLDCVADVKGQEFGHVIMPYLEVNEFPNPLVPARTERNLFYVGVSRTRQRLTLLSPTEAERRSGFLRQMQIAAVAPKADQALRQLEDKVAQERPVRLYLTARYEDREEVRQLGAQFDTVRKQWYIDAALDTGPFQRWL
jgi:DNA helicase-2/ATP-dependent DNA helicase PcrA